MPVEQLGGSALDLGADVFCASRVGPSYDGVFGTLAGGDLRAIVDRATPVG